MLFTLLVLYSVDVGPIYFLIRIVCNTPFTACSTAAVSVSEPGRGFDFSARLLSYIDLRRCTRPICELLWHTYKFAGSHPLVHEGKQRPQWATQNVPKGCAGIGSYATLSRYL